MPGSPRQLTDGEILPADPKARRMAIALALGVGVLGAAAVWAVRHYQRQILELAEVDRAAAVAKAIQLTDLFAWVVGLSLMGIGLWAAWLGRRIHKAQQFPPPGMRVIRDTPVRTGPTARRIGLMGMGLGLAIGLMGPVAIWLLRSLARTLLAQ